MEELQAQLDALEAQRQEILKKMKAATPATLGDLNTLKEELKQEILAAKSPPATAPAEHTTTYLASGLGMTTIDSLPGKESAKTEWELSPLAMRNRS